MCMTKCNRQGIRRICTRNVHTGQLQAYHMINLTLIRMPHANDRLFHFVRGVFRNRNTRLRRNIKIKSCESM